MMVSFSSIEIVYLY